MKRIYLLVFLFAAIASNAFAHRTSDIKVTLAKPTSSTVLQPNGSFDVDAIVTNLGPDSIKSAGDSVLWYMSIQNGLVNLTIGSQSGTTWLRHSRRMNTNDTFHVSFNGLTPTGYTAKADSQRTLCFYAFPRGPKTDTFADPNATPITSSNNRACVTFLWKAVGVEEVNAHGTNNVVIYPNPAKTYTNFSFENDRAVEVKLVVVDMSGRVVETVNKGTVAPGKNALRLETYNFASGLYMFELRALGK